jgi:hypothetical protein
MMVGYSVALTVAVASVAGTVTVLLTLRPYRKDYALVASASIS